MQGSPTISYNELVDHFAKLEGRDSQYLPRQQINMPTFGRILRVLWMVLAQDGDLPRSCDGGLAIPPPQLPEDASHTVSTAEQHTVRTDVALSFATANVRTFYKGADGTPGKLHYVREQFKHLHLHFLGLQETRTTACSTTTASVLRLASGDYHGHQGVELWVNLNQPYGWQSGRPLYFTKKDIVVTFASPRCMLVRVHNLHLDFMIAVIYAPQSGIPHSERADWWNDTMISIQDAVQDKDLVLLIDANAASGEQDARHVFQQDDKHTSGTGFLRELLETHCLCLPATSDRHQGDQQTLSHGFLRVPLPERFRNWIWATLGIIQLSDWKCSGFNSPRTAHQMDTMPETMTVLPLLTAHWDHNSAAMCLWIGMRTLQHRLIIAINILSRHYKAIAPNAKLAPKSPSSQRRCGRFELRNFKQVVVFVNSVACRPENCLREHLPVGTNRKLMSLARPLLSHYNVHFLNMEFNFSVPTLL